jgi:hypothetical protein
MNTIYNEISEEFGSSALSINNPLPKWTLTISQCANLIDQYGYEKATLIAKRYASLQKKAGK